MKRLLGFCLGLLLSQVVSAKTWFIRSSSGEYGLEDGTSYSNAFDGQADYDASYVASGVVAGDVVYYCGVFDNEGSIEPRVAGISVRFKCSELDPGYVDGVINRTNALGSQSAVIANQANVAWYDLKNTSMGNGSDNISFVSIRDGASNNTFMRPQCDGGSNTNSYFCIATQFSALAANITGVKIYDVVGRNLRSTVLRLKPKNTTGSCAGTEGTLVDWTIDGITADNVRVAFDSHPIDITCNAIRGYGWYITDFNISNTKGDAFLYDWRDVGGKNGYLGNGVVTNCGDGTIGLVNCIQSGQTINGLVEYISVYGVKTSSAGDGNAFIADRAGTDSAQRSNGTKYRGLYAEGATQHNEACGFMNFYGENITLQSSIFAKNTNGICVANATSTGFVGEYLGLYENTQDAAEYSISAPASVLRYSNIWGNGNPIVVEGGSTAPTQTGNSFAAPNSARVGSGPRQYFPTNPDLDRLGGCNGALFDIGGRATGCPATIGPWNMRARGEKRIRK